MSLIEISSSICAQLMQLTSPYNWTWYFVKSSVKSLWSFEVKIQIKNIIIFYHYEANFYHVIKMSINFGT